MKREKSRKILCGLWGILFGIALSGCSASFVPEKGIVSTENILEQEKAEITERIDAQEGAESLEGSEIVEGTSNIKDASDSDVTESLDGKENSNNSSASKTGPEVRGIYITGPVAGSARMEELISLVKDTSLNTVVIDIKNDEGQITYKMEHDDAIEMSATVRYIADFGELMQRLHEEGIYVIGRIVCFKDPILAEFMPELKLQTQSGGYVVDANGIPFVNPYRREVWEYLSSVAKQAYADGVDEIQFDYVRFPVGEDAERADYGVDMESYSKQQCLSDFFCYMKQELGEMGIRYGADLFGTVIGSEVDTEKTGQDYGVLATVTDVLCPMIYPSHYAAGSFGLSVPDAYPYETVRKALEKSKEILSANGDLEQAIVRPWLQCFNATWVSGHIDYDADAIRKQIQAVYDAGYQEWILWNASNHYDQVAEALQSGS